MTGRNSSRKGQTPIGNGMYPPHMRSSLSPQGYGFFNCNGEIAGSTSLSPLVKQTLPYNNYLISNAPLPASPVTAAGGDGHWNAKGNENFATYTSSGGSRLNGVGESGSAREFRESFPQPHQRLRYHVPPPNIQYQTPSPYQARPLQQPPQQYPPNERILPTGPTTIKAAGAYNQFDSRLPAPPSLPPSKFPASYSSPSSNVIKNHEDLQNQWAMPSVMPHRENLSLEYPNKTSNAPTLHPQSDWTRFATPRNGNGKSPLLKAQLESHYPNKSTYSNNPAEGGPSGRSKDSGVDRDRNKERFIDSLSNSDMITCLPGFKKSGGSRLNGVGESGSAREFGGSFPQPHQRLWYYVPPPNIQYQTPSPYQARPLQQPPQQYPPNERILPTGPTTIKAAGAYNQFDSRFPALPSLPPSKFPVNYNSHSSNAIKNPEDLQNQWVMPSVMLSRENLSLEYPNKTSNAPTLHPQSDWTRFEETSRNENGNSPLLNAQLESHYPNKSTCSNNPAEGGPSGLDRDQNKDRHIDSLSNSDMITCLPGFRKRINYLPDPDPELKTAIYKVELRRQIDEDRKRKKERLAREKYEEDQIERKIEEFQEEERRRIAVENQTRTELEGYHRSKVEQRQKRPEAPAVARVPQIIEPRPRPRSPSTILAARLSRPEAEEFEEYHENEHVNNNRSMSTLTRIDTTAETLQYNERRKEKAPSLASSITGRIHPLRKGSPPVPVVQKKLIENLFITSNDYMDKQASRQINCGGQSFLLDLKTRLSSERDLVERRLRDKLESTQKNMNLLKYTMNRK